MESKRVPPPSDDPRWRKVEATMLKHGYAQDALIEVLHTVQEQFEYLDIEALAYVGKALNVHPSTVYGVATFYHFFSLEPPVTHRCMLCTGTACHLKGADKILEAIEDVAGIAPGEHTPDFTLETARCVGYCSPAPVVVFDDDPMGELTPQAVVAKVKRWMHHAA